MAISFLPWAAVRYSLGFYFNSTVIEFKSIGVLTYFVNIQTQSRHGCSQVAPIPYFYHCFYGVICSKRPKIKQPQSIYAGSTHCLMDLAQNQVAFGYYDLYKCFGGENDSDFKKTLSGDNYLTKEAKDIRSVFLPR